MRYYKVDKSVPDIKFATEHSTLFDLKAYIKPGLDIKAYSPYQKEVNIPIKQKADDGEYYITIQPQFRVSVPTGILFSVPVKFQLRVTPYREFSTKTGVSIHDGMEIYDNDYTDEVRVTLFNSGDSPVYLFSKEVIAQATLNKVLEYSLDKTSRKVAVKKYDKNENGDDVETEVDEPEKVGPEETSTEE